MALYSASMCVYGGTADLLAGSCHMGEANPLPSYQHKAFLYIFKK